MRSLHLLPLAVLASTVGACSTGTAVNRGVESIHHPVVSRTNYVYDVPDGADAGSTREVSTWLESMRVGYGDRISVDNPSGNRANVISIAALAARYGLILEETAPVTPGEISPGMFRVVVVRSTASVPGCPNWSRSSVGNFDAGAMSNFGCATAASLAAMAADPEDFVAPRRTGKLNDTVTTGMNMPRAKGSK
jgi:pilus assembly protein CpaD